MSEKEVSLRDQVEAAYEAVEEIKIEETPVEHDVPEVPIEPQDSPSEEEKPESLDAPNHWSPEDRESFNELDERARKLYLKRYKEMEAGNTKKSQKFAEEVKLAEKFKKTLEPYQQYFKQHNIDEFDAFQRAATAHLRLINASPNEKMVLIQKLAMDYGINYGGGSPQQHTQESQQQDPQTLALLQKVQTLEQRQQSIEQDRIQREYSSLENQIVSFQNMKDDKGEAKYPHFETLRLDMSDLLQKGLAQSLEDAYNKSFRLNDDLHQEYINVQYNNRMKEADTLKKTAASKKAGFNVKGSGGSSIAEPSENLTTRQIIERAYDRQQKRQRI